MEAVRGGDGPAAERGKSGVQSLDRAFQLLELMGDAGGALRLHELEAASGLPLPTIHRLIRALAHNGYVRQEPSRRYALGPRLVRLGQVAGRGLASWAMPHLGRLVAEIGETANMAILEGDEVVYIAQVPSPHSMRMFTEVGRHAHVHCTGVGKALLSQLPDADVVDLLRRAGMPAKTSRTLTDPDALFRELAEIREQGWAQDDAEQEVGVRCVAAPVLGAPARVAISVSGPSGRITASRVGEIAPVLQRVAAELAVDLPGDALG